MASDVETTQSDADATGDDAPEPGPILRGYCRLHSVSLPTRYPVQPRPGMAVRRPLVVATRPGEELLCDELHDGPHLWPDGDEAGKWTDGVRDSGTGMK